MSNYKPGDIAVATVHGYENVRVTRSDADAWFTAEPVSGDYEHADQYVTDIRPLVVLDPEDMQQVKSLIRALRRVDMLDPSWDGDVTRAGVARALRSLVAPPKPAEPRGLGAVVKDAGKSWVHFGNGCWIQETPNACRVQSWSDFSDDVEVDR